MLERILTKKLISNFQKGKVIALFGARRTGKTTILRMIIDSSSVTSVLLLNGEDYDDSIALASGRSQQLKNLTYGYDYLFVDEAQNIPNIGKNLKLLVDSNPEISVFVTGSSAFDLKNQIGEPLTGRARFYYLYPFTISELSMKYMESLSMLSTILIYGTYPQVNNEKNLKEKRLLLENIKNGYMLKDVLALDNIKDSHFIISLLRALAFQIGNNVSYNELSKTLNASVNTVIRYIELLEKSFIIFRLFGYSNNLRKEISKSPKIYFWDNGLRNVVISSFNDLNLRYDIGQLWENFCISERIKKQKYKETFSEFYFWRTYDQQEIDLIEVQDDKISAFEFKWNPDKKVKIPRAFRNAYPDASFDIINKETYFNFLIKN